MDLDLGILDWLRLSETVKKLELGRACQDRVLMGGPPIKHFETFALG